LFGFGGFVTKTPKSNCTSVYTGEKYITTAKFDAGNSDEVSFGVGVLVEVLQKNLEGWWLIRYDCSMRFEMTAFVFIRSQAM